MAYKDKKKAAEYKAAYKRLNMDCSRSGGLATTSDAGEAAELLVAADLLTKGHPVTKPYNRNGPDDLHFKYGTKWYTVQVKIGRFNRKTGVLASSNRNKATSDVFAVVDLITKTIRYLGISFQELPPELLDAL